MQHLMKRLEIIKAAISLEDEETIRLHMEKIRGASEEAEELKLILTQLEALDYSNALNRITTFLTRTAAVSLYVDPEVAALHQAYHLNDLTRVEGILATLAGGESFAPVSEQVEDKNQLRAQIRVLREQVETLTAEIKQIRSDDTWRLVVILDGDYATFFTEQETALQAKLVRLQQEFMELV